MPELPEVETTLRGIDPHIRNKKITGLVIRQSQLRWSVSPELAENVLQQKIRSASRRASSFFCTRSVISEPHRAS